MFAPRASPAVSGAVRAKSESPETITNEHPLSERKMMKLLRSEREESLRELVESGHISVKPGDCLKRSFGNMKIWSYSPLLLF